MPVKIQGKEISIGKYNFVRYMNLNGVKTKISTYQIEKTKDGYVLFNSRSKIDDEIRTIQFQKNGTALMWSAKTRIGLQYTIENYTEKDK